MIKKTLSKVQYKGYNNRPHKVPDPKELKVGVLYAISLNPGALPVIYAEKNDSFKYNYRHYTNTILNKINKCVNCNINVNPELSSSGKWHYHGWIKIQDLARFMLYDIKILKQYFCFEIDTIANEDKWREYVLKGEFYMKEFCESEKIPYKIQTGDKLVKLTDNDKLFDVSYMFDEDEIDMDDDLNIFRSTQITHCPSSE